MSFLSFQLSFQWVEDLTCDDSDGLASESFDLFDDVEQEKFVVGDIINSDIVAISCEA